jgi:hypothetical protein
MTRIRIAAVALGVAAFASASAGTAFANTAAGGNTGTGGNSGANCQLTAVGWRCTS